MYIYTCVYIITESSLLTSYIYEREINEQKSI